MTGVPFAVKYQDRYYFPMFRFHSVTEFGVEGFGEPDYRDLKKRFSEAGRGNWVLMAPYPYGPNRGSSGSRAIRRRIRPRACILLAPTIVAGMCSCASRTVSISR